MKKQKSSILTGIQFFDPPDIFQKEAPEVARAFDGLIEALKATKGLIQEPFGF